MASMSDEQRGQMMMQLQAVVQGQQTQMKILGKCFNKCVPGFLRRGNIAEMGFLRRGNATTNAREHATNASTNAEMDFLRRRKIEED